MTTRIGTHQSQDLVRPAGGYRLVGVGMLFAGWWAYRTGLLRLIELRTYFAVLEAASRRCVLRRGTRPRFTVTELSVLLGVASERDVRRSLSRLSTLGLVRFQCESMCFAMDVNELSFDQDAFQEQFQGVVNRKRRVPVPRRTLRMLARCRRPAVIATVLGTLFRCVYAKGLNVASEGSVSSTWIADVFQLDARNVKRARAALRARGWLDDRPSDHWHRQRYGARVAVNLEWGEGAPWMARRSPPRASPNGCKSPPPETNRKLLNGFNNQKPSPAPGIGVYKSPRPDLRAVRSEDLAELPRLLVLFDRARRAGWVSGSEYDRIQFVAAAFRARRLARRNVCGFFLTLVRGRMWHHLQAADEDEARRHLRAHFHGGPADAGRATVSIRIVPTRDIHLVAQLTSLASQRRYPGDPFELVQHHSSWNRDRWDRALRGWLGAAVPGGGTVVIPSSQHPKDAHSAGLGLPTESPLPPHGRRSSAGRSGVKVEPSEKRLRVLAE